ncbi:TPA: hypothetical protein DEO28_00785 [Candidatus Dependentiae bacterium]|nr:MAG: hypothetical protein UR14_C0003G0009 [candidate division TM6 bacterium GW2011_GWE2_31_21]KKP54129.1 MAG: hypothetical protein UR43_C0001G0147 [candidate division TM6 bacterium GW2011_GWF2_33_332]HBS47850.1 hypothetical protein [Candidatus Dependentiae bacterium]HBZ73035.1 hypothetical protein [Candidatus Dependentiae bacterium]
MKKIFLFLTLLLLITGNKCNAMLSARAFPVRESSSNVVISDQLCEKTVQHFFENRTFQLQYFYFFAHYIIDLEATSPLERDIMLGWDDPKEIKKVSMILKITETNIQIIQDVFHDIFILLTDYNRCKLYKKTHTEFTNYEMFKKFDNNTQEFEVISKDEFNEYRRKSSTPYLEELGRDRIIAVMLANAIKTVYYRAMEKTG